MKLLLLSLFACVNRGAPAFSWLWTEEPPTSDLPDLVAGEVVAVLAGDAGLHHPAGALVDGPCTPAEQDAVVLSIQHDVGPDGAVFWLGDNVYPKGWRPGKPKGSCVGGDADDPAKGMAALRRQIAAAPRPDRAFFIPGNHDYAQGGMSQRSRVDAQAAFLRDEGANAVAYDTPVEAVQLDGVTVIAFDSQWAVRETEHRPAILTEMDAIVASASARGDRIVFATHHPIFTAGPHGFSHYRGIVTDSDMTHRRYASWRYDMRKSLKRWGDRVQLFAAGHEHSLQLFKGPNTIHTVVGSAAKASAVRGATSDNVTVEHAESNLGYALLTRANGRYAVELIAIRKQGGPGCVDLAEGWFRCRVAHRWLEDELEDVPPPSIEELVVDGDTSVEAVAR